MAYAKINTPKYEYLYWYGPTLVQSAATPWLEC